MEEGNITVKAKGLSPREAIGITKRKDYPILSGQEVMLMADFDGSMGQAFTSSPCDYQGTLEQILAMDLDEDGYARGIFIAALNAVAARLGKADRTVHCKNQGPETCAEKVRQHIQALGFVRKVGLIGYQPAIAAKLSSDLQVRILDLNPDNIGQVRAGCLVEDGNTAYKEVTAWADLILCTGSTICNGSIVNFMDLKTPVLFFGTTLAGAAPCLGLDRICYTKE